ncbi:MAG TPA: hypothetical protein VGQ39_23780 [Pyrinomonadaceae bacterium]|jgi:hypothetical protein|nr:hypothetical protein [Pyrinomonadaceae bacterium]
MPAESIALRTAQFTSNQWSSVTPLGCVADWYLESLEIVRRLGNMDEGWDGYGSPSIPVRATIKANYILSLVSLYRMNEPHIAPVPGGGLQLEWDCDNRSLEIEVHPTGQYDFLIAEGEDIVVAPLTDKLLPPLLNWIRTGNLA